MSDGEVKCVVSVRAEPAHDDKTIACLLKLRRKAGFKKDPILLICDHGALGPADGATGELLAPITVVEPPVMGRVVSDKMHCFWYAVQVMHAQPAEFYVITSAEVSWDSTNRDYLESLARKHPDHLVSTADGLVLSRRLIEKLQPCAFDAMRGIAPTIGTLKMVGAHGVAHA